jgi:hypothetical protein
MSLLGQIFRQGLFDHQGTRLGLCQAERVLEGEADVGHVRGQFSHSIHMERELLMIMMICLVRNDRGT